MSVECLHTCEQLPVVPARDEDLSVRSYCSLKNRKRPGREFVLFELRDLKLATQRLVLSSGTRVEMGSIRKVAAWLCQQFSGCILASAREGESLHVLDLCVGHDVVVLDAGTTFLLPREACRRDAPKVD